MAGVLTRWAPRDFVDLAFRRGLYELSEECGARFVLVVPLGERTSELHPDHVTAGPTLRAGQGMKFRTLQGDASMLDAVRQVNRGSILSHTWDVPGAYVPIPRKLLESQCQVLPICKSGMGSFLERISIGRVQSHDIVLRHPSVSKFHGWFEVPDDGQLYVGDAGSLNATYVNNEKVSDRTRVAPGAQVRFGLLETRVYTLESFWKALHQA